MNNLKVPSYFIPITFISKEWVLALQDDTMKAPATLSHSYTHTHTLKKKIKKKGESSKGKNNTSISHTQQQRWYKIVQYLFLVLGILRKTSRMVLSRTVSKLKDIYCTLIFF